MHELNLYTGKKPKTKHPTREEQRETEEVARSKLTYMEDKVQRTDF